MGRKNNRAANHRMIARKSIEVELETERAGLTHCIAEKQKLRDRVAELEKENAQLRDDIEANALRHCRELDVERAKYRTLERATRGS